MRRVVLIGVGLLISVLLVATGLSGAFAQSQAPAVWTVAVYLDGDNNLDPDAHADLAEMSVVGSTADVNVIVLLDEYDGPAKLLKVTKGSVQVVQGFPQNGLEADMGDGNTLATFVDFVAAEFPAGHVLLDLWDHGDDFRGFAWDDHPNADNSPGSDFLTHTEIINALSGHHFDIIAFDGCVMSNLEVTYEYASRGVSVDYMIASEIYIPNQGFAYDGLLAPLAADPSMSAADLGSVIVDSYMAFYNKGGWQVGLSVIKMSEVPALVSSVFALATGLESDMAAVRDCVGTGRGKAHLGWSMYGWEAFVDFPTFVSATEACLSSDTDLTPLFDAVSTDLSAALPYVRNTHGLDVKGAGGIGVFFPGSAGSFEKNVGWHGDYFLLTRFAQQGWYAFLQSYWGAK